MRRIAPPRSRSSLAPPVVPSATVAGCALVLLAAVAAPAPAPAEVQIKTLADGTKLIYNETAQQKAVRTSTHLLPVPSTELGAMIDLYARRHGLSSRLVQAVVQVESGYNSRALSNKGAMGLMQLMPETARDLAVTDPYDPDQNVRGGTAYLSRLLTRYQGDLTLALAAYNAGPTRVDRYGDVPPFRETEHYVRKVLALYHGTSNPSLLLQEHARDQAELREEKGARESAARRRGDPVHIARDEEGRILITTTAPQSN